MIMADPTVSPLVYVVDDDPSMRRALTRRLEAEGFGVRAFADSVDFLAAVPSDAVGCALLDVRMPGMNGFELQSALAGKCAYLPVVFLTAFADIPSTVRAMKSGASDVLTKPVRGARLIAVISATIHASLLLRSDDRARAALRGRYARLTPRERQVFDCVAKGQLNKQVAHELGIAERTVKAHRAQLMSKMHAATVAELAAMYVSVRSGPSSPTR
jgi:FixJ family two-component response regulator